VNGRSPPFSELAASATLVVGGDVFVIPWPPDATVVVEALFGRVVDVAPAMVPVGFEVVVAPGYALLPLGAELAYASHVLVDNPSSTTMLTMPLLILRRTRVRTLTPKATYPFWPLGRAR
jgi:hypothetical protein